MENKKTTLAIIFLLVTLSIYIQGCGTLMDWSNLKKYQIYNEALIKTPKSNRIVFIGNSISEGWGFFKPCFYHKQPFCKSGDWRANNPSNANKV